MFADHNCLETMAEKTRSLRDRSESKSTTFLHALLLSFTEKKLETFEVMSCMESVVT